MVTLQRFEFTGGVRIPTGDIVDISNAATIDAF